jgi:hypothetical protein
LFNDKLGGRRWRSDPGACDVRSIVMLSPLRELDILQILDKLLKLEIIALR